MTDLPVLEPVPTAPDHYRPQAPAELVNGAREFVRTASWTFAKTMPWAPHWYTLRRVAKARGDVEGYDAVRELIVSHHYLRTWHTRSFRGVTLRGLTLWIMEDGLTLVNAKPAEPNDWEGAGLFEHL